MTNAAVAAGARGRVTVGRYVVLGRLGRGGMGVVYRALDEALEREVALKILTAEGLRDSECRQRFAVEAKAAAQLQHANIVTIYELGEEGGIPFIAMEYLPGVDLEGLLRSGEQLLLAEKLQTVAQVCRGLAYAHERRIVHRDVKPSNIRLLDDGTAKIVDFGIAKLGGVNLTQSGMVVGTVHYMSPEQVRGRQLDGRSDVFSVGVVLYELLAGSRPFDGGSATEILFKIVHAPTPALPALARGPAPERLTAILSRALAKEPDERYLSASAMADDLLEAQGLAEDTQEPIAERLSSAIAAARQLLRQGRFDEGIADLRAATQAHPGSVDARRALRSARRLKAASGPQGVVLDDEAFSELAATFQLPSTRRAHETLRAEAPAPQAAGAGRRGLLWAGIGVGVLSVFAALLLLLFRGGAAPRRLAVRSEPPGARVFMGGRDTGILTNGEVLIDPGAQEVELSFHKDGYLDAARSLKAPFGESPAMTVTLVPATSVVRVLSEPPGAAVTLDGKRLPGTTPLDVTLAPDQPHRVVAVLDGYLEREAAVAAGQGPREIVLRLESAGPPAVVSVASSYPLDVVWNGKTLAHDETSPRVSLPPGRQLLTLVAPVLALRTSISVEVRGGTLASVSAPPLGRVNVQAHPDNCEILIDGVFADYPPIRDRPIVVGTHRVEFRWPDGRRATETAEVVEGRSVFVMGRP